MAKLTGKRSQVYNTDDNNAITVTGVSKSFRLPHNRQNSLKGAIVNLIGGGDRTFETQEVLKDVSFEIKKGEFFGIVGRNGSGKSTLLKMLAGIYKPTAGEIVVNGGLTPFIELGVGFNPELTGRENVFLNGALLGFNDREVSAMYDDIVSFAELARFMDQKLKNYSSGMQVRLAFSIAIRARSDILLLDEVLAVGDEAFQRKCYDYFEELKRNKKTVILVTHDMPAVEKFCNRGILIENGQIIHEGKAGDIALAYRRLFNPAAEAAPDEAAEVPEPEPEPVSAPEVEPVVEASRWGNEKLHIEKVRMSDTSSADSLQFAINVSCKTVVRQPVVLGYTVRRKDDSVLFGNLLPVDKISKLPKDGAMTFTLSVPNIFPPGDYALDLSLRRKDDDEYCDFWRDCQDFTVSNTPLTPQLSYDSPAK